MRIIKSELENGVTYKCLGIDAALSVLLSISGAASNLVKYYDKYNVGTFTDFHKAYGEIYLEYDLNDAGMRFPPMIINELYFIKFGTISPNYEYVAIRDMTFCNNARGFA